MRASPKDHPQAGASRGVALNRCAFLAAACLQEIERIPYAVLIVRNVAKREAHFDSAERPAQHQIVEPAEMADPKNLAAHLAESLAQRQIVAIENRFAKRIGVVAL